MGRRGVYPLCFLKSVQALDFVWLGGGEKTSVWKLQNQRGLPEGVVRIEFRDTHIIARMPYYVNGNYKRLSLLALYRRSNGDERHPTWQLAKDQRQK